MQLRPAAPARGVLRAVSPQGLLERRRVLPPPALAPFVHHLWSLRWDLRSPLVAEALPHPSARIMIEEVGGVRRVELLGVITRRVVRQLEGKGQNFGVAFRPAMAQPLLRALMASLTDRAMPLARALGPDVARWGRDILAADDLATKVGLATDFLAPCLGPVRARVVRLRDLVERIAADRSLLRLDDVCEASGLDARALQRAFSRYVGVSPKSVLQRYRLLEASEQLCSTTPPSLAALAASLGYADQAHFARDFKLMVGRSPGAFVRGWRASE